MISIIMPAFNRFALTINAINSAVSFIHKANFKAELIFVDDMSSESEFIDLPSKYQEYVRDGLIKFFRLQKNHGVTYAKNFGAEKAKYDWIVFLDADDLFSDNAEKVIANNIIYAKKNDISFILTRSINKYSNSINGVYVDSHFMSLYEMINHGTYGECMLIARKRDFLKVRFINFLRGSEGLSYLKMLSLGYKFYISSDVTRIYSITGDRLSSRKNQFIRARFLLISNLLLLRYLFYMNISTLVGNLIRVIFYFIAIFISPIFLLKTTPKHNSIKKEISLSECTKNINHARKFDDYVSVIINVHNGEKFLNETISNALSQTHKNIKIIVYDNYSQDKTADICKKYENKISYYKSEKFLSLPEARNKAVNECDTEFIAFLDADDLWCPEKIEIQLSQAKNITNFCMSFTDAFILRNGEIEKASPIIGFNEKPDSINKKLFSSPNPIVFSSIFLSKKAFDSVGGFSSELKNSIDYDLYLKFANNSGLTYTPHFLTIYRIHDSNLSKIQNIDACRDNILILKRYEKSNELKLNLKKNQCLFDIHQSLNEGRLDKLFFNFVKNPYCFFYMSIILAKKLYWKIRQNLK